MDAGSRTTERLYVNPRHTETHAPARTRDKITASCRAALWQLDNKAGGGGEWDASFVSEKRLKGRKRLDYKVRVKQHAPSLSLHKNIMVGW